MVEERLGEATLAALPEDAPHGHRAHDMIKCNGKRCYIDFGKGPGSEHICCRTTVVECGSETAMLRIARAMWMKLEAGATREEVLQFRAECLSKLRAVATSRLAVKRQQEIDEDASLMHMATKAGSETLPSSSSKRARGLGASLQDSSCGRHSIFSSTRLRYECRHSPKGCLTCHPEKNALPSFPRGSTAPTTSELASTESHELEKPTKERANERGLEAFCKGSYLPPSALRRLLGDQRCAICFEPLVAQALTIGLCGHIFHRGCSDRGGALACPSCRRPLDISSDRVEELKALVV